MEPHRKDRSLEELLGDAAWIRGLARRLAGPDRAEDLVQAAWVAVLAASPPRGRVRSWFAGILRNVARMTRRTEGRRHLREVRASRGEAVDGPEESLVREELRRTVAGAVLELREPYRTALLDRFYAGRSAAEIARQRGISASTVRSQIQRGLVLLRERLGDREDLRPLALPLPFIAAAGGARRPLVVRGGRPGAPRARWPLAASLVLAFGCAVYAERDAPIRAPEPVAPSKSEVPGAPPSGDGEEPVRPAPRFAP